MNVGGVVKVMKQVLFGPELEIGPGMSVGFFPFVLVRIASSSS